MREEPQEHFSFPKLEERVLDFWEKNKIFEKSVRQRKGKKKFVFYEGPPTANGKPGVHHVEARAFKDVILRYKTMRGYFVPRRAGWDTHGLPVEIEVEKTLGLKNKKDIEAYGVAAFNKKCRESVWQYKELWEKVTRRMGFWLDMAHPYVTYENPYMESLWWVIKEFAKKGYLYEDYKVVPWCVRCGTALSSHELAQGYEKIKEESIYVKFKVKNPEKIGLKGDVFVLAWTTTPWTLPGNVALAVGPDIIYALTKDEDAYFILSKERLAVLRLDQNPKIVITEAKEFRGSDLIGVEYEPLYKNKAPYKIVAGDFVSTEEGTGIVHIAPAFGDDDFKVGKKNDLPVLATTNERGLMDTPGYPWNGEFFKKANPLIRGDLAARKLLFKTESYEHDYPFCWRCKTPLMYFARKTWWVAVNKVRPKLLANNETIHWHPDYLKHGRFGGWLKEEKDWAFSRERYWGTPLPVWRCKKCPTWDAVGSVKELEERALKANNRYVGMRHGEAVNNTTNTVNSDLAANHFPLTRRGKEQVKKAAGEMRRAKITPDLIFSSPFLRTKETAELAGTLLGVALENIKIDPRLGEIGTGLFSGKHVKEYRSFYQNSLERFAKAPPGGESLTDVKRRMRSVINEMEGRYRRKTILIISHEDSLWALWASAYGKTAEEAVLESRRRGKEFIKKGGFEEIAWRNIPRDDSGALDLHKPYIDQIELSCTTCGGAMQRVPEVVDVWFDSGSMPFAQAHYPFAKADKKLEYPADYIVEAVDQTRGWFYNLLAVGTLLGRPAPYRNVISLGHVLDEKGKKMSKSLGNVVDPSALIEKYGADPVRWYFFTINQPWDSKLFAEKDVQDASRRFFMILWNTFQFWKMYGAFPSASRRKAGSVSPKLLINQWAKVRLQEVVVSVTQKMDAYDIVGAARDIEYFVVEDVSRWYIRRIRSIMRSGSRAEVRETSDTLRLMLTETAKLLAPFAPFLAEAIYHMLGGSTASVHLAAWPSVTKLTAKGKKFLAAMDEARKIAGLALEARAKAGIKVRQPLQTLSVKSNKLKGAPKTLAILISDEVNVKDIVFDATLTDKVRLDTVITPALKEEGVLRDLVREVQAKRKDAGLKPKNKISLVVEGNEELLAVIKKNLKTLQRDVGAKSITMKQAPALNILIR